jgi:nicotinate-nucleotide adenylyltransferase
MKLGIYGGTFSPPHKGHVDSAKAFCDQLKLDKLLIIPTNLPPHKDFAEIASATQRLEMCGIAFSEIPCASVSDMEIRRGGRSYTYLTLEELSNGRDELYLLCGTDMILTFDRWVNFQLIFSLATICYVRRETDEKINEQIELKVNEYREKYGARIIPVQHNVIEVSSTEIRDSIRNGLGHRFVDENTLEYIFSRGLYR